MKRNLIFKQLHFLKRTLWILLAFLSFASCVGTSREESSRYSSSYCEESFAPLDSAQDDMVWVVSAGKRYHRSAACSNMKAPFLLHMEIALERGYTACAKCY